HPVLGFQYQADADRFLENFRERLKKFGLELHPDKTRRIEFGRFAEQNRKKRGEGKPETFDFLGFSHISGKDRKSDSRILPWLLGSSLVVRLPLALGGEVEPITPPLGVGRRTLHMMASRSPYCRGLQSRHAYVSRRH